MIIGDCPYDDCDQDFWLPLHSGELPKFQKHTCEACGRTIWTLHSRIDPKSWTEEAFKEEYDVDEATGKIKNKAST